MQERRNKDIRNYREHHARKNSRANTMEDQLHHLLASSDPVVVEILRADISRPRCCDKSNSADRSSRLDLSDLI